MRRTLTLFSLQRNCLHLMGHNLDTIRRSSVVNRLSKIWESFKHAASLLLVLSAQGPMISYAIFHIDNLALMTSSLSICLTNVLTVIKISTFLLYKKQFLELVSQLDSMYKTISSPNAKQRLNDANNVAMRLVKLYFYSTACTGLYFMIGPIIKIIYANITNKNSIRDLPMPMRFPFDFESSPGYECCFMYTFFVTLSVVMYAVAIDGFFMSFSFNLCTHFQCLGNFIETNSFLKPDSQLSNDFRNYIEYHSLLLNLTNQLRQTYKPIIFGQFLMTSLQVCVIIYQLVTHMDTVLILIIYCTFLSAIMLQLLIYCYGGEILRVESFQVGNAIQLSKWYRLSTKHRRTILLILMRSQRETVMKAGFYEASLANFMTILKAAMSYITLIQSFEKIVQS